MKKVILLVLIILISSVSFAELKPGKLFINNVEIPYTSKTDLEIYLYPKLNTINNDFMIYTKSKDEPINQKIFAFVYDINQNRIKTMELFNDGRTVGYGNFFKMDNIGIFTVKLCIGNSEESCNELSESVTFEVGDFNCKSLFEEHNNINADRINMILLGHGYENEEILKKLLQKILTFDGNPILTNMYDKKTNEFVDKQLRWGLFSIEPFKSNKNKFNIWYSLIEEPVQDFLEKIKDGEGGYNLCGLKYPYIAVLDQEVFGMIASYPNFYDSPKINKEDISFGISFNSYDVISDSNLHPSGRFVYYEEVGEQINDIITYTPFSLLPHETGHALIGLTDEFETGGFRHVYPHCAKDINEAKEWWGDLIGQIDPFYYDYIRIMKENRVNIPRGYNEQELGNYLTVGYYSGGCGIDYGNSGAVRPTYTSMMDDATIPIFGSVNSARIKQVLNLFSGEEKPPKQPKSISYVYANGQRIAKVENNEVYYFHNDHLGSPVAITNSSGNVIWQADYLPFGESFNELSFDGNNIKYNSKELDKDTDLYYYGARYYNAPAGRFITADTVKGEIVDPQSLNLYVYTKNNPIKYIDPSGNTVLGGPFGERAVQELKESKERVERGWQQIKSGNILEGTFNIILGELGAVDPIGIPGPGMVNIRSVGRLSTRIVTGSPNVIEPAQKFEGGVISASELVYQKLGKIPQSLKDAFEILSKEKKLNPTNIKKLTEELTIKSRKLTEGLEKTEGTPEMRKMSVEFINEEAEKVRGELNDITKAAMAKWRRAKINPMGR